MFALVSISIRRLIICFYFIAASSSLGPRTLRTKLQKNAFTFHTRYNFFFITEKIFLIFLYMSYNFPNDLCRKICAVACVVCKALQSDLPSILRYVANHERG